jgi:hypothetical protein
LRGGATRRRPRGLGLQGSMHPFMPTVLFGVPGLDELGQDPEAEPPSRSGPGSPGGSG